MNEQERIEILIENYFDIDYLSATCTIDPKCLEPFKKEMLKILLPWRDFEKEKPEEDKMCVCLDKSFDKLFIEGESFDKKSFIDYESRLFSAKYWIYKEELLKTLPEEE